MVNLNRFAWSVCSGLPGQFQPDFTVLSKGAIGKALLYAVNQLPLMDVFFEDGRIHLDNNAIENKIRPLALGRKNFLFAGSHEGAKRIAMMYSFFASC